MASYELRAKEQASVSPGRYVCHPPRNEALTVYFFKDWEIPGERLLLQNFPDVPLSNVLRFEGLANRNSMSYAETYSLKNEELRTMLRGTLRYNDTFPMPLLQS